MEIDKLKMHALLFFDIFKSEILWSLKFGHVQRFAK